MHTLSIYVVTVVGWSNAEV